VGDPYKRDVLPSQVIAPFCGKSFGLDLHCGRWLRNSEKMALPFSDIAASNNRGICSIKL
jgi:hypothetical protein